MKKLVNGGETNRDFAHFFGDGTKLKIIFEIKQPLKGHKMDTYHKIVIK